MNENILTTFIVCCWVAAPLYNIYKWEREKKKRTMHSIERGDLFENILSDEDVSKCLRNGNTSITELLEDDELERFLECNKRIWKNGTKIIIVHCIISWIMLFIAFICVWNNK